MATPSYVLTLKLNTELWQEHVLEKRFQISRVGEIDYLDTLLSPEKAAKLWGLKDGSSIRHRIDDFPPGTTKKIGKQWVVSLKGMEIVFGDLSLKK